MEFTTKQTLIRTINAKKDSDSKKIRGNKYRANFIIYSIKK